MIKGALFSLLFLIGLCARTKPGNSDLAELVGGPCEGCEAVFEYGKKPLSPIAFLPGADTAREQLVLTGSIYLPDGKTPAKDVVLYIYHTNANGIYAYKGNERGWIRRHGNLRGWIKTDATGNYTFTTLKPGHYPARNSPAHIHATILEPGGRYYYLEDYYFEGDSLLTQKELSPNKPRGGTNGVLQLQTDGKRLLGHRDFILGKNVPGY